MGAAAGDKRADAKRAPAEARGSRSFQMRVGRLVLIVEPAARRKALYSPQSSSGSLAGRQSTCRPRAILDCLERGEIIKLASFGSFIVSQWGQRVSRNPETGVEVPISARRIVVFKPSVVLKQRFNSTPDKSHPAPPIMLSRAAEVIE